LNNFDKWKANKAGAPPRTRKRRRRRRRRISQ